MIAFGHTAVGVMVGLATEKYLGAGNLATGLISAGTFGVVSHYLTDFIPHGHFFAKGYKKKILNIIIFDLALSIILFLLTAYWKFGINEMLFYIMFGIGGSQLPDVLDGFIHIGYLKANGLVKLEFDFHQWIHWHGKGPNTLILGLRDIWQLVTVFSAWYMLFIS